MTPQLFLSSIIEPAVIKVAPILGMMDSPRARGLLLKIAGVESAFTDRIQKPVGYAHGFWQCEKYGAVANVLGGITRPPFLKVCLACGVDPNVTAVFAAIVTNDALAYAVARLNLWPDPAPLPAIADEAGGWDYYKRIWRPGKPDRHRWAAVHAQVIGILRDPGSEDEAE